MLPSSSTRMTDQEIDARFESFAAKIRSDIRADIRADITAEGVVTRRHFDVVAEGLRAEIKVIADGHEALRSDVAALNDAQERLEHRQERLEIRQLALEHRQGKLEEGQRDLVTEVRLLAGRLA